MDPVAEAENKSTAETWDTLQAARPLILKICLSPSQAGPWLAEQVFVTKLVRIRWQKIDPPDARIEDFERGSLPTVNLADNSIAKLVVARPEDGVVGLYPITLLGVEVLRESIIALRPGIEVERPQSQQSITLNLAHATIGEVSFAAPVTRMARRVMALAAALLRRPAPPAEPVLAPWPAPSPASATPPTPKKLRKQDESLEWLYEKIEQHGRPKFGEKTKWCHERLNEGKVEFVAGEFPWKDHESIRTKLNDIIAGRLVLDLRTGRLVRPPKQKNDHPTRTRLGRLEPISLYFSRSCTRPA
jgi:hypothetical protein